MRRAARVPGPWELDHHWQCARGPSLTIDLKFLAIPSTSTLEKQEPVDIKLFREDFPFVYFKGKRLILKTVWRQVGLSLNKR